MKNAVTDESATASCVCKSEYITAKGIVDSNYCVLKNLLIKSHKTFTFF